MQCASSTASSAIVRRSSVCEEPLVAQPLRGDVEQLQPAGAEVGVGPGGPRRRPGSNRAGRRATPCAREEVELVLHQRDQRRDDQRQAVEQQCRATGSRGSCRRRWERPPAPSGPPAARRRPAPAPRGTRRTRRPPGAFAGPHPSTPRRSPSMVETPRPKKSEAARAVLHSPRLFLGGEPEGPGQLTPGNTTQDLRGPAPGMACRSSRPGDPDIFGEEMPSRAGGVGVPRGRVP